MSKKLKVLHLPETALPWTTGGKEVFVQTFAEALHADGVENLIAIHRIDPKSPDLGEHEHRGIQIRVLPELPDYGSRKTLFSRQFQALPGFRELLLDFKPDIVHFHDQGGGASLSHLEMAKSLGIKTVLTYHTPGQTCPEGELLRNGHLLCDGRVELNRCTVCRFKANGAPSPLADILGRLQLPLDPEHPNRILRLLTARHSTQWFKEALTKTIQNIDAVILLAEWSRAVWLENQCPPEKLHLIRTAGEHRAPKSVPRPWQQGEALKLVCMGRFVTIKGFHVLVEAIQRLPLDAPIQVQFLGPYNDNLYGKKIQAAIANDPRFLPSEFVKHQDLQSKLTEFHLAVIPSTWPETGPLVVFDAFAAGLPILGSRLGGIAELVQDNVNGLLFTPNDSNALANLLQSLLHSPTKLQSLQANLPQKLRTMSDISKESIQLYQQLLA